MKPKVNQYLSTKNIKRRRRVDELMIMVAIVAIAGTALVFNSYASRKIETQKPGEYSFVSLLSQRESKLDNIAKIKSSAGSDIYYMNKLSTINTPFSLPENKFCVYGWNRSGAKLDIGVTNIPDEITPIEDNLATEYPLNNPVSRPLKCFNTSRYYNTKSSLVLSSGGDIWLDKVVTE